MPKYYCDYCDVFLTHDSQNVRKQHNHGRKHRENVKMYFLELVHGPEYAASRMSEYRPPPSQFGAPPMGRFDAGGPAYAERQRFGGPPQHYGAPAFGGGYGGPRDTRFGGPMSGYR